MIQTADLSPRRPARGFTLMEAAVAVAVIAILAGAAVPLTVKMLNQRRTAETRTRLREAFEAMYGTEEGQKPSMLQDFNYQPTNVSYLNILVSRDNTAWANCPSFGVRNGRMAWGYNGPYWLGPVLGGKPVDAWGTPLQLEFDTNDPPNFRLRSLGPDKVVSGDDIHYPQNWMNPEELKATLQIMLVTGTSGFQGRLRLYRGGPGQNLNCHTTDIDLPAHSEKLNTKSFPATRTELVVENLSGTVLHSQTLVLKPKEYRIIEIPVP